MTLIRLSVLSSGSIGVWLYSDTFIIPRYRSSQCSCHGNSGLWLIPARSHSQGFQIKRLDRERNILPIKNGRPCPGPTKSSDSPMVGRLPMARQRTTAQTFSLNLLRRNGYRLGSGSSLQKRPVCRMCIKQRCRSRLTGCRERFISHMFQGVALVNNGQYGGVAIQCPFGRPTTELYTACMDSAKLL